MSQNIYIRQPTRTKKKISFKKLFFLPFFISLILLTITLRITEGKDFNTAVGYVLGTKNSVIYDTYTISFDQSIPSEYVQIMTENLEKLEFQGKRRFETKERNPDIYLLREQIDDSQEVFSRDLIPVGHIYSLVNEVTKDNLSEYSLFTLDELDKEFLQEDYNLQVSLLGSYEDLIEKLKESDSNVGLIGFDDLDFRVKILNLDGKYYLENQEGCVSLSFYAKLKDKVNDHILSVLAKNIGIVGQVWQQEKLAKVNMSGVVAITRGLAIKMDNLKDYSYPAREIGAFLSDADLTHVSNEVSFVPDCKSYSGINFCSRPEYIETLKKAGVNIVELTGNHNNDFGAQYNTQTIQLYESLGMRYYGGGLDKEDASKILYEQVNGSTVAFLGYNYYDTIYPSLALAGESRAGANSYSDEKMQSNIQEARENADVVIVTFQFQECYSYPSSDVIYPICYKPLSNPDQRGVFKKAIDFGADIVVGSQAHQPQTYELYGDGVIFYGTGNLFFDQNIWIGTRQGLVLSHYVYEGKLVQTRITPIYMGKDDLMPRLATQEQGDLLLKLLKEARN